MDSTNKKILLIEDEEVIASMFKRRLSKTDLTVLGAVDGKSGLEIALKEKPDLILLDLSLPVMSGIEFLVELRKDVWGKNAVVVALTNNPDEEALRATREL